MNTSKYINENKYKITFYFILYISLIIGFFFSENLIGGAEYDYKIILKATEDFSKNLSRTYNNFEKYEISHFPFYYMFLSLILKITDSISITKFIILHLNLFLPYIFYKVIKLQYNTNNKYLFYLPGIFFLSPSFRSTAIWGLNDNIALIFFVLSIYFYLKFNKEKKINKKINYIILHVTMLAFSAYTRQYFAVFSIYFFYNVVKSKNFSIISWYIFTNLILSFYALKSIFYSTNLKYSLNFVTHNPFNNITFTISIFIVYFVPFIFNKKFFFKILRFYTSNKIILLLGIFLSLTTIYFFNYNLIYGGGIIYKIFYKLNNFLYFFIFFLSFYIVLYILKDTFNNYILFLCVFLAFPTYTIYQKYFDPLSIIIILCLLESSVIKNYIDQLKFNIKFFYIYFLFIFIGNLIFHFVYRTL